MTTTSQQAPTDIVAIPLAQLGLSIAHQVRPVIDEDVDALAETDESEWDIVEVRVWPAYYEPPPSASVKYHVVSGNHRTRAARKKGLTTLRCRIIDVPDELSYKLSAIKSNTRHGKNFTAEQRALLAKELSEQGQSLAEIAKVFGVHKSTVSNWLSGRDSNASKKRVEPVEQAEPLRNATAEVTSDEMHRALLSWIASAPLNIAPGSARLAIVQLPQELQEKVSLMAHWLGEVLS